LPSQPEAWGDLADDPRYFAPSGGFGPVDDQGYGVSYMIAGMWSHGVTVAS
jgi:hypothetical protein